MIRRYCMKCLLVVVASFAAGHSWSDPRDEISDKTKAVWTDYTLGLFSNFIENIPFNSFDRALCVFDMTRYWEHTNFMGSLGGEKSAYALSLNYNICGESYSTMKSVVMATQEAPSSPTMIDYWKSSSPDSKEDYRRSALVYEEPTSVNPLGIVDINTELVDKASKTMLAKTRHQSVRNEQGLIEQYAIIYIDATVSGFASDIGQSEEYYSSRVIKTGANKGYGTIVYKDFGNHGYPEGRPNSVTVMNIVFDEGKVKSKAVRDVFLFGTWHVVGGTETCLARNDPWQSIRFNGYGVYDEYGDKFVGNGEANYVASTGANISVGITNQIVSTALNCRLLKDGSLISPFPCPDGYESWETGLYNDPVPDLTVATFVDSGQKLIIRQLRPLTVQQRLAPSECDNLELQGTLALKDSNYLEEIALSKPIASSGAVMVNNYGAESELDLLYNGKSYPPTGDPDGDGVPNYLDVYPEDASRDYDKDYDGEGDANDPFDDRFVFDHSTFFVPNAVEVLSPSMAVPE